ncbi:TEF transcription factor, PAR bZIP family member b isoform X1 [Trichomycterus rosablanca]|uniref:TEF transcription factor, PAR bZIP family member b isoform X1 n=1 Tax=Trichomycterus rosablanca TaxID=2290929 RepID=UPI002F358125
MDAQTTVTISVAPSNNISKKPLPFVLKKIMSILPPNILDDGDDEKKLSSIGEGQSCEDEGGGGGSGVSASLTPAIWDKTIPYDGENFHLEYMDLDEFLLENQIPSALEEELHKGLEQETQSSSTSPDSSAAVSLSIEKTERANKTGNVKKEDVGYEKDSAELQTIESAAEPKARLARATPSPMNPEDIEVNINFQPDQNDLVLSSIPGGKLFNPRKHRFSEEELKPQPIIKKAKKVFISEDAKEGSGNSLAIGRCTCQSTLSARIKYGGLHQEGHPALKLCLVWYEDQICCGDPISRSRNKTKHMTHSFSKSTINSKKVLGSIPRWSGPGPFCV